MDDILDLIEEMETSVSGLNKPTTPSSNNTSATQRKPSPKEDMCFRCGKEIFGKYMITEARNHYHSDCFVCSECASSLTGGYLADKDEQGNELVFCGEHADPSSRSRSRPKPQPRHDNNVSDSNPRCNICHDIIAPGVEYLTVQQDTYHTHCFRCHDCGKEMTSFGKVDDFFYCSDCYKLATAKKDGLMCGICKLVIGSGQSYKKANQMNIHNDCFRCATCRDLLSAFAPHKGKFYCGNCIDDAEQQDDDSDIAAEQERIAAQQAEQARQAQLQKEAEQRQLVAQQKAEEEQRQARLQQEAEQKRIAAEQAQLQQEAEQRRLAAQQKAEEEQRQARLQQEAEQKRIAAEQAEQEQNRIRKQQESDELKRQQQQDEQKRKDELQAMMEAAEAKQRQLEQTETLLKQQQQQQERERMELESRMQEEQNKNQQELESLLFVSLEQQRLLAQKENELTQQREQFERENEELQRAFQQAKADKKKLKKEKKKAEKVAKQAVTRSTIDVLAALENQAASLVDGNNSNSDDENQIAELLTKLNEGRKALKEAQKKHKSEREQIQEELDVLKLHEQQAEMIDSPSVDTRRKTAEEIEAENKNEWLQNRNLLQKFEEQLQVPSNDSSPAKQKKGTKSKYKQRIAELEAKLEQQQTQAALAQQQREQYLSQKEAELEKLQQELLLKKAKKERKKEKKANRLRRTGASDSTDSIRSQASLGSSEASSVTADHNSRPASIDNIGTNSRPASINYSLTVESPGTKRRSPADRVREQMSLEVGSGHTRKRSNSNLDALDFSQEQVNVLRSLSVKVIEATNLISTKTDSSKDKKHKTANKFKVVFTIRMGKTTLQGTPERGMNPRFDQQFEFFNCARDDSLELVLFEGKQASSRILGRASVPLDSLDRDLQLDKVFELQAPQLRERNLRSFVRLGLFFRADVLFHAKMYQAFLDSLFEPPYFAIRCISRNFRAGSTSLDLQNAFVLSLLELMEEQQQVLPVMKALIEDEVSATTDANVIFREPTFTTRVLDQYLKLVSKNFLEACLAPTIKKVIALKANLSLDPSKLTGKKTDAKKNLASLKTLISFTLDTIFDNVNLCPSVMRALFAFIQSSVQRKWWLDPGTADKTRHTAVAGFLFLRYFCPTLLAPMQSNLADEHLDFNSQSTLILIAKTIQKLANLTLFDKADKQMTQLNPLLESYQPKIKEFVSQCSSSADTATAHKKPAVDVARDAAYLARSLSQNAKALFVDKTEEEVQSITELKQRLDVLAAQAAMKQTSLTDMDYKQ